MDKDSGVISGQAWNGLDCAANENRPAGSACGYGWLSFTSSDLTGCPTPINGKCEARVNLTDGTVSGWAKFTSADVTKGAWDGWVSLRGSAYGVCYGNAGDANGLSCKGDGATNSTLNGWAWGNDVTGWINFGVLIPPILKKPIVPSPDGTSVTLNWTNGMGYSKLEIFRSSPETDVNCTDPAKLSDPNKCRYINVTGNVNFLTDPLSKSNGFDKTATVSGLAPGQTYGFFVRAHP